VEFDLKGREVVGAPVPVLDGLSLPTPFLARYSVSRNGTVIYSRGASGSAAADNRLVVVDHEGGVEPLGMAPRPAIRQVGWAPNGREVVFTSEPEGGGDSQVFIYDVELNSLPRQLTFEGNNTHPRVSPDGTQVAFASSREGTDGADLFVKSLVDDRPERSILSLPGDQRLSQWYSDSLMVFEQDQEIWTLDLSDADAPAATRYLAAGAGGVTYMVVSPDGTLAAYRSRSSGSSEIYVSSFPTPGAPTKMSEDGGNEPFWAPDGNTLYYAQPRAGVRFTRTRLARNPVPVVLAQDVLFEFRSGQQPSPGALHPDGTRWILAASADSGDSTGVGDRERQILVVNWFTELRERMGRN
jgi:Tol biopolymer transport system component